METQEKKSCNTCKNKGLSGTQWGMVVFSFYLLFTSVYGTIQLFKLLFSHL